MPKKLPKQLFVKIEMDPNDKGISYFMAADTLDGLMDDDGPETVGIYKLVETTRVEKVIQPAKSRK